MSKRMNVTISDTLHQKLKSISVENGIPISSLIVFSIMNFLDQRDALASIELYKKFEAEKMKNNISK